MKKILTVIFAVLLLIGNFHPVYTEENNDDSQTVLETHDLDPETLHVEKLGETDEEEPLSEMEPYSLDDLVRVSIVLDEDATLNAGFSASAYATNAEAKGYRDSLRQQQEEMTRRIEDRIGSPLNVKWNLTLAVNIISAELKYKDIVKVKEMDGIKDVFIENRYEAYQGEAADPQTSNTSSNMVGASQSWDLGYTGAGTKIAIIDTGLDIDHQSFKADAFIYAIEKIEEEFNKEIDLLKSGEVVDTWNQLNASLNANSDGSDAYLNEKVPYKFNYIDINFNVTHLNDTEGEHGSHVAGIAAANRFIKSGDSYVDAANTVKAVGMAPDAQLLVMKVFGEKGGAYDSDYMAAIEDAIVLGADSVNLSLGSASPGFTYTNDYQETLNHLAEDGIKLVVSISAGNAYDLAYELETDLYIDDVSMHTGGSPGTYINSLCVAAAENIGVTGTPLTFNGSQEVFYTETSSTGARMSSIADSYNYVYIDAVGETTDYDAVNDVESLSGKIVIVNRGEISFYEKGNNVISHSPKALIVANNQSGTISMDLSKYTGAFPIVSITLADANTIKANSASNTTGNYTFYTGSVDISDIIATDILQEYEDAEITDFSSWGVPGSLIMKPEITAPGGDIYSVFGKKKLSDGTEVGGSDQYELMSGTSMAAPHIAGLSAVLAQYLSENGISVEGYSQRALNQSLLMSTAVPMKNNGEYLSILQQGSGLVDVSKAITATSVIMMDKNDGTLTALTGAAADGKVKAEFGDNPSKDEPYRFSFTIYNTNNQTVFYDLNTELFTQAFYEEDGEVFMSRQTSGTLINTWNKTYRWYDVDNVPSYDVNSDGITDGEDVQAILDYVIAEEAQITYSGLFDEQVADFDQNGKIESADAYQLLDWINEDKAYADGEIPANSSRKVEVVITPNDSLDAYYPSGAYVEGYTYVSTQTTTSDGAIIDVVHSIPILGFYGSWTDPSMFNNVSYIDTLYGSEKTSYTGKDSNYLTIKYNGVNTKFSGNPYKVEDEFPKDHLAISSNSLLSNIHYNLIRSAAGMGFALSKTDALNGNVTDVLSSSIAKNNETGIWYYYNQASWQNLSEKFYRINKTVSSYGLHEGDTFRVGFYAIPEYNAMKNALTHEIYLTNASATSLSSSRLKEIVLSNELGSGAYVGYDFVVDDTLPQIDDPVLDGNSLTVHASDDRALAYLAVLSLDGEVIYAETTPAKNEETITFDASDAIANAHGYVAVFAGDYAGNEVAKAVKVNDNTHVEKTVYVLTNTLTAGQDYLIVSNNAVGTAYALGHSGATVATNKVSIKTGIGETGDTVYIDSVDATDTSIWTVSGSYKFENGNYYLGRDRSNTLKLNTGTNYITWSWDSEKNRLSINNRYLCFDDDKFSLNTTTKSVYLYKKTIIVADVDPYGVDSVSVSPDSLDLFKGNEADLVAKVLPLTATDHSVTWSSSNSNVVSVDEHGHVMALAAGTAIITAISNQDDKYSASCEVKVTTVNKALNGIVWDEEGGVYFSNFNPSALPSYNKLHDSPVGKELVSAIMNNSTSLYAGTLDTSTAETVIYSVNRSNYTVTEYGPNYLYATDMAIAATNTTYQKYVGFAYTFGPYLVGGPVTPGDDGEGGTYCGLPYAAENISSTTGDAYAAGIATKSRNTDGGDFYVLDENGVIWQTTLSYNNSDGFVFSSLTKVIDTGIATSFLYQNLYYDGTYIYWSHYDGNISELIIINPTSGAIYHAGDFGDGVWPVGGIYVNGSVAPASVEDEMMDVGDLDGLKPVLSREEMMNSEIMDRFYEEAERMARKSVQVSYDEVEEPTIEDEETVEIPEEPAVEEELIAKEEDSENDYDSENEDLEPSEDEPVIEETANESTGMLNRISLNVSDKAIRKQLNTNVSLLKPVGEASKAQGDETTKTIVLTETEEAHNGVYVVNYDPEALEFNSRNSASDYTSFYNDGNGKIYLAYADYEGIEAGGSVEELIFTRLSDEATQITVNTIELNFEVTGDGQEFIEQRIIEIEANLAVRVASCSLSTGGDIGVNFYLDIPEEIAEYAYVSFQFQGDTTTYKVLSSQLTSNGYRYTVNTTSKDMRDPIVLTVHDEEGQLIRLLSASGKTNYTAGYTYSVSRYFELARRNYTGVSGKEKLLALVEAMDTYGMYAQILFDYNAEGLEPADVSDITQEDVEQYKNIRTGTVPARLAYEGSTLVLDSTICFRHYFTVSEGHDISEYTFTIDGASVQATKYGSRYYVEVSNIAANDLEQMKTTLVDDGTDTYSITYCGLSYARAAIRNNYKEADLCRAMYKYYLAAEDYFN